MSSNISVPTIVESGSESKVTKRPSVWTILPEQINQISTQILPADMYAQGYRVNDRAFIYPNKDRSVMTAHSRLYGGAQAKASFEAQRRGGRNNSCALIEAPSNDGREHQIFFAGLYASGRQNVAKEINDTTNFLIREANSIIAAVGGDYIMEEIS